MAAAACALKAKKQITACSTRRLHSPAMLRESATAGRGPLSRTPGEHPAPLWVTPRWACRPRNPTLASQRPLTSTGMMRRSRKGLRKTEQRVSVDEKLSHHRDSKGRSLQVQGSEKGFQPALASRTEVQKLSQKKRKKKKKEQSSEFQPEEITKKKKKP